MEIALPTTPGICEDCRQPVLWAFTALGASIPLETDPDSRGLVRAFRLATGAVVARVHRRDDVPPPMDDTRWYLSHHASCPRASRQWSGSRCPVCGGPLGPETVLAHPQCDPAIPDQLAVSLFPTSTADPCDSGGAVNADERQEGAAAVSEDDQQLIDIVEGRTRSGRLAQRIVKERLQALHEQGVIVFLRLERESSAPVFVLRAEGHALKLPTKIAAAWCLGASVTAAQRK